MRYKKIPILYNVYFNSFFYDILPLYGKGLEHVYNEKRFRGVREYCLQTFDYVDSKDSIVVFPKYLNHEISNETNSFLKGFDNLIYGFSNDIIDDVNSYDDNIILYRTALLKSKKKKTEYSFPVFCEDLFENNYVNSISIGYCGHLLYGRKDIIKKFNQLKYNKKFIIRDELLTGTKNSLLKSEFFNNIKENLFTLCCRGAGNYCYRFYETLMMGRIPILIDSDRCFIFEDYENLNSICITIQKEDSIKDIESKIDNFIMNNNLKEIQKHNRFVWETYCSPIGFLKQFIKNIY